MNLFVFFFEFSVSQWFSFGLTQYCPNHHSPPISLQLVPEEELGPVCLARHLLEWTGAIHCSDALFVTMIPQHGAAACVTLCQCSAQVLQGVGWLLLLDHRVQQCFPLH